MTSIFTKIINDEIPSDKLYENEYVLAIKDIYPVAPIHILIIPKKEIRDLQSLASEDFIYLTEITKAIQILAKQLNVEDGYRVVVNNGEKAGQTIFHLHFHLIAGRYLDAMG